MDTFYQYTIIANGILMLFLSDLIKEKWAVRLFIAAVGIVEIGLGTCGLLGIIEEVDWGSQTP